jgi:hypothetical protein
MTLAGGFTSNHDIRRSHTDAGPRVSIAVPVHRSALASWTEILPQLGQAVSRTQTMFSTSAQRASVGSTEASDGRLGGARVGPIDRGMSDRIGSGGADNSRAIWYQRSSHWTWPFSCRRTLSLPWELALLVMKFLLLGEHR